MFKSLFGITRNWYFIFYLQNIFLLCVSSASGWWWFCFCLKDYELINEIVFPVYRPSDILSCSPNYAQYHPLQRSHHFLLACATRQATGHPFPFSYRWDPILNYLNSFLNILEYYVGAEFVLTSWWQCSRQMECFSILLCKGRIPPDPLIWRHLNVRFRIKW